MRDPSVISRAVVILSLVSLFTDIASESLYPVMPVFLKSIGFSVLWIGLLEGIAEATAGLSKGYFGNLSDRMGKRLPFVRLGYALSAISKPLMAVTTFPLWIFFTRVTDRIGKGLRTAPRDAILSTEATHRTKGRVFGFHRSLDTVGAATGPLLALVFLHFYPGRYRELLVLAFLPGLAATLLTFVIKEKPVEVTITKKVNFFSFIRYLKESPVAYKRLLLGLLMFALINSSDLFLIIRAKEAGLSDTGVIGIYIFYNLVYAVFAYPAGVLADKIGHRATLMLGLILFVFVYAGMARAVTIYGYGLLFFVYGIYAACTESISKALISNNVDNKNIATALGAYNAFQSIAALLSSSLAGLIWYLYGPEALFISTAGLCTIVIFYFAWLKRPL